MVKLGILGGTSLLKSDLFASLTPKTVSTPHGKAIVHVDPTNEKPFVFLQRHHADGTAGGAVYNPPHKINYRANIFALQSENVTCLIAICCVGSLKPSLKIGTLVFPDDYFQLFGPSVSFFDDERAHMVPGIDAELRSELVEAVRVMEMERFEGPVTYVQTTGPRFETRAEVRFLTGLGDVIGMTAASEATMAKEIGLPYAILGMVDNMANGVGGSELSKEQFQANVAKNLGTVERAVHAVLAQMLV